MARVGPQRHRKKKNTRNEKLEFTLTDLYNSLCLRQQIVQTILIQDRQCTYNLTLRRFRPTTVAVEQQSVLHIVSVCL